MAEYDISIIKLDINGMNSPIGIDDRTPLFHYYLASKGTNKTVTARQVQVTQRGKLIWDSGKLPADGTPYVAYAGLPLCPKEAYTARARVWDELDVPSSYCAGESFETGFLGEGWAAQWIEPEQEAASREERLVFPGVLQPNASFFNGQTRLKEAKELKKTFRLSGQPVKARLYATAHGVYELTLNGKPVSARRLAPETTRYDKIQYYQTYDIGALLQAGGNTLTVLLADGWWIGRLGISGDSCNYGDRLGFLMQLELEYADRTRRTICSDESFRGRGSYIRYADLFIGEKHDHNYQPGPWLPCKAASYDMAGLRGQFIDPMSVTKELGMTRLFRTPAGELVLDFGQVLSGVLRVTLRAQAGAVITFDHGEVLSKEGNFNSNILGRNKNQQDLLVCREGTQTFEPKFTYHGFRYVRVFGLDESGLHSAKALVLGTPLTKTGNFHTDNEDLNRLQHNIEWSTVSNMMSVPTDCPQREKLGWTGDIQIYTPTGGFLYDLRSFLGGWLRQMRADQYDDGQIPVVIPNHPSQEALQINMSGENSSSAWSDACILVPLYLYRLYGDRRVLSDNFKMMRRWLAYAESASARRPQGYEQWTPAQKARNPYLWTKGYHFGDWLIPSLRERPDGVMLGVRHTAAVVGACCYAIIVKAFIEVCQALGEAGEEARCTALLPNIQRAVREEFVSDDGTVNGCDLQGVYVMVLKSGACEGGLKQRVLEKLVSLIEQNGWRLDTGFSSVPYLLEVLYENGRADTAYRLLYQTEAPSWLYMVKNGATSMWENWRAVLPGGETTDSSYNHYAFGCVGEWMYRRMGGIYAVAPGYKQLRIAPDFTCGLQSCECSYASPYGEIACAWHADKDGFLVRVKVPVDTTATVALGTQEYRVGSGAHEFTHKTAKVNSF